MSSALLTQRIDYQLSMCYCVRYLDEITSRYLYNTSV